MSGKFDQINEAAQPYETDDWNPADDDSDIRYITPEEGWEMFDRETRRVLNMGAEEFLRRYDAGEFDDILRGTGDDHSKLISLEMMIPFARPKS